MTPLAALYDPDAFFERESEDPELLFPALVVIAAGLLAAMASLPMMNYLQRSLTGPASGGGSLLLITTVVGVFVGQVVGWVIVAAVLHFVSGLAFDGDGPFTETLAVAGWGYAPAVVGALVSLFGSYWVFSNRPPGSVSSSQEAQMFLQELQSIPEMQALTVVGMLFVLWQAFVWAHGIRHVRDVSLRHGAITAAIPAAGMLLFRLFNLL